jgi:FKBP-type peptidyl-prolyl cis-trans isomerase FkpA
MSTSRSQRIGIWVIAVVLTIGTIGSFFVIILANNNSTKDQASQAQQQQDLQKKYAEYQAKVQAQADELSKTYYPILSQYTNQVAKFNADDVKSLVTADLKEGDGAVIDSKTTYSAYYIGWNPDGKIFDQSIDGSKLKSPIAGSGLIKGWTQGVIGMKLGGVRELTIPADLAYGDSGQGDLIPPHTPIKFIVLAIPSPTTIPVPDFGGAATQ